MRLTLCSVALCLLAGCGLTPPKPTECVGEFRPVNTPTKPPAVALSAEENLSLCKGDFHVQHAG